MLKGLFSAKERPEERLYRQIVAAARQPEFYLEHGVPDTLDGRFDMIVLHMFLALDRLSAEGSITDKLRQSITDRFFLDMDRSLREMGVGDLSVGKKVRKMAEAYHGRIAAYAKALNTSEDHLVQAIARNVFATQANSGASDLAQYLRAAKTRLAGQSMADILASGFKFK